VNLFQAANGSATFLILSAVVAGLAKHFGDTQEDPLDYFRGRLDVICLGLFIIVFRIKATFDDHKHFGEVHQDQTVFRYIGFVLAILSWVFWALAGYLLPSPARSSELMATSILISTSWIAVHLLEILVDKNRRGKEVLTSLVREKWVLINVGYMLCLVAFVGWFRPVVTPGKLTPLLVLLGLFLFDALTSRSFKNVKAA
jgi:hypothetical protein